MKYIKIFICIMLIFSVTINITSVYGGFLDTIFGKGNDFFTPGVTPDVEDGEDIEELGPKITEYFTKNFVPMIGDVGNLVFFVVAAFLGVKFIWSGVEGKSEVKETLPTFVVGACLFFLADNVYKFATGTFTDIIKGDSFGTIQNSIWGTVAVVVNVLAIAGIVALGLKYMLASADTKADIKKDLVPVVIGLIFVFATSNILNFIVDAGNQVLPLVP